MPGLDGFQVIERIRERERHTGGHLPVVAFTARSRVVDRERCLSSGMDDFLSKPVKPETLWAIIDRLSHKYLGMPYPNFTGKPETRVLVTIEADKVTPPARG